VDGKKLKSLLRPEAYPDPAEDVRLVQTHISWIFLAGEFVYKIKKPVDFGFLNFSTLDRRLFYCHEEVRLNSRLCPEIYLGVVPLREAPGGVSFTGSGTVVDHAVKMKRLPEERMADRLLASGRLTGSDVAVIAARIAEFHGSAERGGEIDAYGNVEAIARNWEENFHQAEAFAGITFSRSDLRLIRRWVDRFMKENAGLFADRVAGGFIRACDGDIHLENICLTDKVCIFDCIEFNNRFRYTDTAADIAFLLMDLEFYGRRDLADLCLAEYLKASADDGMLPLIRFYVIYRAFVRGKVESFRLRDPAIPAEERSGAGERAKRYFRLARGYILRENLGPALLSLGGLSGSGKSTIAQELAMELGLELLSSDRIRKELAVIPETQRPEGYGTGLYSAAMNEATYGEILARVERALASGRGAIVDATCRRQKERESLARLAEGHGAAFYPFMVECPEKVVRQRLEERERLGTGVSDAGWEVYLRQRDEFEPLLESETGWRTLDGSAAPNLSVDRILTVLGLLH